MDDLANALHGLTTPAFLVDRARVAENCRAMREKARLSEVIFRPHVKTHKTIEIALMQHGGERGRITVSTMAEAEFFAAAGFDDITYAVPLGPDKIARAASLAQRIKRLNILIDSRQALVELESFHAAQGVQFDAFLKVDCGYHRAGVDPDSPLAVELAMSMWESPALRFRGLLTHAGHSYNVREPWQILEVARHESQAVTRFRDRLRLDLIRSVGSTPTASVSERFVATDEVRPGNYVFYDAFQAVIGSCQWEECSVSVLTTVIGSYPARESMIVDAGALALSKDLGPHHIDEQFGYGLVCDLNLRPTGHRLRILSQEHGKLVGPLLPVGARLRIIPNHSCLTAAMYDRYQVIEGAKLVDEWKPVRGW